MPTNTKVSSPFRDKYRESCFQDAYKVSADIETTNFLSNDGNWEKCILKFSTKKNIYGLIEIFKQGSDNSTDYVILEKNGKELNRYDRFIDAELELVNLIRGE